MSEEEKQEAQLKGQFLVDEYSRMRRIGAMIILGALAFLTIAIVITALLNP
jgi:hypothetical protein